MTRVRPGRWLMAVVVSCALCVPAAVAVPVLALRERTATATADARATAATAARQAAEAVLSYDYRTVDADIAHARTLATGVFAAQYAESAQQLAAQAKQTKAIVQATASEPAVVTASEDAVVVLVFVDQASVKQLKGDPKPTTRIDQSRVRLTMTRVHGRWLVSQLAAL